MLFLVAVPTDGVIIETGIFDQPHPLSPPRRDVAAVVLVEVLPEEGYWGREEKRKEKKTWILLQNAYHTFGLLTYLATVERMSLMFVFSFFSEAMIR